MRLWALAWDVACELWELAEPIVDVLIEGRGQKSSLDAGQKSGQPET